MFESPLKSSWSSLAFGLLAGSLSLVGCTGSVESAAAGPHRGSGSQGEGARSGGGSSETGGGSETGGDATSSGGGDTPAGSSGDGGSGGGDTAGGSGAAETGGGTVEGTGGTVDDGGGTVVDPACSDAIDHVAPSINPPGGLPANTVPMFVVFGIDDNGYADGINWVLDNMRNRKNPDGTAARATWFISGGFDSEFFNPAGGQSEADLLKAWKRIKADGHEIANHSWSHSDTLAGADESTWQSEITKANDLFVQSLGVEKCKLWGFRTPFLAFSEFTFQAIRATGIRYDASIEFGYDWWQPPGSDTGWGPGSTESGKHYYWPFTMDQPLPAGFANRGVGPSPGLWEFPAYTFNKISGDMASVVTGLDYNLWNKCQSDSTFQFTEVLKQSLDQRLSGNRSPLSVGMHSDIYSQFNESANGAWTSFDYQARRKALGDFIDYAQSRPEVRIVTFRQLIDWMRHPTRL